MASICTMYARPSPGGLPASIFGMDRGPIGKVVQMLKVHSTSLIPPRPLGHVTRMSWGSLLLDCAACSSKPSRHAGGSIENGDGAQGKGGVACGSPSGRLPHVHARPCGSDSRFGAFSSAANADRQHTCSILPSSSDAPGIGFGRLGLAVHSIS